MSDTDLDTAPDAVEFLADRRSLFLQQRTMRATYRAIAADWNAKHPSDTVSATTVRKDVEIARRTLISEATREAVRGEHMSIIHTMRKAYFPAMLGGDIDAGKMIMSGMVREAEMLGTDEPKRSTIGVGTDVEFAETLIGLMRLVDVEPPKDLVFAARGDHAAIEASRDESPIIDAEVDEPPEYATPAHEWSNVADD